MKIVFSGTCGSPLNRARNSSFTIATSEAGIHTAKLPSGYHRDLQRIKAPLFRTIDLAGDVLAIMAHALPNVRFKPENIRLPPELTAAEQANDLVVREGLPFREAYRRIAALLKQKREP